MDCTFAAWAIARFAFLFTWCGIRIGGGGGGGMLPKPGNENAL